LRGAGGVGVARAARLTALGPDPRLV